MSEKQRLLLMVLADEDTAPAGLSSRLEELRKEYKIIAVLMQAEHTSLRCFIQLSIGNRHTPFLLIKGEDRHMSARKAMEALRSIVDACPETRHRILFLNGYSNTQVLAGHRRYDSERIPQSRYQRIMNRLLSYIGL